MKLVIAYPGDRPPILCSPPSSYEGTLWRYARATQEEAAKAVAHHRAEWPDWEIDEELLALAGGYTAG
jgi:hypothetical protein